MRFNKIAVSLFVAAATIGAQAYASDPERNEWLQDDYNKAPAVAQTATSISAPLAQLDMAKNVGRDEIKAASATAPKAAYISEDAFRDLDQITQ